jgi:hypothetical protein
VVGWATSSYELRAFLLYGPLALGGLWGCVLLPLMYFKVARLSLWGEPQTAILMAPAALNMAGWLGVVSSIDPDQRNCWLTHVLAVAVILFALPPICAMPRMLGLYPRRPFTPALAVIGFPMEIVAIALVRYHAVLRQDGAEIAGLWRVIAWIQVVLATVVVAIVLARYLAAAITALRDAPAVPKA